MTSVSDVLRCRRPAFLASINFRRASSRRRAASAAFAERTLAGVAPLVLRAPEADWARREVLPGVEVAEEGVELLIVDREVCEDLHEFCVKRKQRRCYEQEHY